MIVILLASKVKAIDQTRVFAMTAQPPFHKQELKASEVSPAKYLLNCDHGHPFSARISSSPGYPSPAQQVMKYNLLFPTRICGRKKT